MSSTDRHGSGAEDGNPAQTAEPAGGPPRDGHTESMLPEREVRFPTTVHHVHRRPLGLSPPPLLAAIAAVSLVIALSLLIIGSWIAGILFLAGSGLAAGLFLVAIRREPDEQASRLAVSAAGRADGFARLTAVTLRASTREGLELAKLWARRRRLRFELRRQLAPLGEAVHRDENDRVERLKAQADELDQALRETDLRASEAIAALRGQIERERATSQSTQRFAAVQEAAASDRDSRR